ncbi:zinc finger domain-containing protein tiptop isoform X1 [Cotesia typhae]|uniref:zinc finger domain-containing protein tiptop isoform X1 n=2 Tax=Cotesia typhae TaxID=2053667 RepID=UPI003D69A22C
MRSKQQPRPSFRWPQQRGDNVTGEDGIEGSGPGTELQAEDGECVDEDGPISPNERNCPPAAAKEDDEADATDDEDSAPSPSTPPPSVSSRLNPIALRDTGPPDREPMSPRCPSRDSRESSGPAAGSPPPLVNRSSASPLSPGSIVPLAGHPLLPSHSAAVMAAYIQQTHQRLLLGHSPLSARGSVSPLVTSSCSPPAATPGLLVSPTSGDVSPTATPLPAVLDFSTRKVSSEDEEEHILNLSKPPTPSSSSETNNGPLDLSVSSRKRPTHEEDSPPPPPRKSSRLGTIASGHQESASAGSFGRPPVVSPWTSPVVASHFPYFAAAVAAATSQQQLSPKSTPGIVDHHQLWNGKMKPPAALDKPYQPSEATKALEKMSELSKLGGDELYRPTGGVGSGGSSAGSTPSGASGSRHSAWQSHWLNKGADQAKDVLKCVWCKQSFPTLAAMTTHMKEAKHCGVNMPVPPPSGLHSHASNLQSLPTSQHQQQQQQHQHQSLNSSGNSSNNSHTTPSKQSPSELNLLIKETMPLPRKLVRGQDVWLGKGAEQTRQILKCMWCGQSFRSLAEMTSHMQQTQHYTNIISQEQIISWKSSDDGKGGSGPGSGIGGGGTGPGSGMPPSGGQHGNTPGGPGSVGGATSSHVSAVLTCKVCDQAFSSLKELSNHMVKNSHYKEHIMRSITESGGRRRQTREKRKKSLPVRKLLELERAQNEFKNGDTTTGLTHSLVKHAGRITCEKCGDKIETSVFVEHIRQCIGAGTVGINQRNFLKSALMSNNMSQVLPVIESGRKSVNEDASSVSSRHHRSPSSASDTTTPGKDTPTPSANESTTTSSPSVLNAIEKLIEKSFDSRGRHGATGHHHNQPGAPIGSSILKRLGIDESVDYTKPLVDPQTMNLLRSYQQQQYNAAAIAARRERSGSESSSISERGSTRTDTMTPERRLDLSVNQDRHSSASSSHRHRSPEKQTTPSRHSVPEESGDEEVVVKKEPKDEDAEPSAPEEEPPREVVVKKEVEDSRDDEEPTTPYNCHGQNNTETASEEPREPSPQLNPPTPRSTGTGEQSQNQVARSPCRNSTSSPASSDRSVTPRGTPDTKTSSSLGALSSMFDSLSGGGGTGGSSETQGRKTSSHPLAALQKLCDKTETRGPAVASGSRSGHSSSQQHASGSTSTATTSQGAGPTPGAILAFSWACNDAVVTADSIMKCAFCDTPFISKGAYRHHLSKMHFVKDGMIPDPLTIGRSAAAAAAAAAAALAASQPSSGGASTHSGSSPPSSQRKSPPVPQANGSPSQAATSPLEESPHSKFLKYTELAKQLSSKYV